MKKREKQIEKLLVIAKVPPDNLDKARQELNWRIPVISRGSSELRKLKNPRDHNDYFDAIEKSAESLVTALKHLKTHNYGHAQFWFPSFLSRDPTTTTNVWEEAIEEKQVFKMLGEILTAAREAKISKDGRPLLHWKRVLVRQAYLAFESIKSPGLRATERGPFCQFAMTFCEAAEDKDVGSILLQVREVLKESGSLRK